MFRCTQKAAPRGVYENTLSGAACSVPKQVSVFFNSPSLFLSVADGFGCLGYDIQS